MDEEYIIYGRIPLKPPHYKRRIFAGQTRFWLELEVKLLKQVDSKSYIPNEPTFISEIKRSLYFLGTNYLPNAV